MAEFVRVKNIVTGAIASLPKSGLRNFPEWEVDAGPPPEKAKPKKSLPSQPTKAVPAASNEKE